jgi:carboxypeptidase Taq
VARKQRPRPHRRPQAKAKGKSPRRRPSPEVMLAELKTRLREIIDLRASSYVLNWDQATYMPPGGADARGRQLAMLSQLAHERLIAPAVGRLIEGLIPYSETLPPGNNDAGIIRTARRGYEKAIKVPAGYVARVSAHSSASYQAWTKARPANDFRSMVPYLEKTLDLSREYSEYFAPFAHIADPHIDYADEGMTTATIRKLFGELKRGLVPLLDAICAQPEADDSCLHRDFPKSTQLDFAKLAAERIGYDFERGRLDLTHHPFCTRFSAGDVRITTRVNENDLGDAFFSTVHESGHAMYEQGVDVALAATPAGHGVSAGVHESQSRLWENIVARSRGFWEYFYPPLRQRFSTQLSGVPLDTFHRAINKVARSLIRTDADEVTYNLHIMLRFDLELRLLEGKLAVKDLAEAWRAAMQADLGVAPPDDRDGCLQDVHWYSDMIGGAFQSYTIGNILAAQFYAAALKAHPELPDEIRRGEFGTLHGWLRENLYRHGAKFAPNDIIKRATGSPMSMKPYLGYLREKYGALYRLPAALS